METAASTPDVDAYDDPQRYSKLSSLTGIILIWFHIQAAFAFFSFSWTNFWTFAALYWLSVGLGISMGYHRLHTHRGFKTSKWFEYFLALCGTLTLEGGPIFWVAIHRLHHQYSDQPKDPHTPRVSGLWAHIGWVLFGESHHNDTAKMARYAPDLAKDPFYRWLNSYHWVPLTTLGVILLAGRRLGSRQLGHLPARRRRPARDLADQLGDAHLGQPPVRDERRLEEHLVGVARHVRRELAQQPPRPPGVGPSRPGVVGARSHLAFAEAAACRRARVGRQGRQGDAGAERRSGVSRLRASHRRERRVAALVS